MTSSGSKYVPPHLRGKAQGSGSSFKNDDRSNGDFGRRNTYSGGRSGGGQFEERRGSYDSRPPPVTNSRWSDDRGGGDSHSGRSSYSDRGGYGGGYRGAPRLNERGFHGNMDKDPRLEARLFDNSEHQTTGINFDRYDKIPIEVSGDNIPDPIEVYTVETIGEDLFRNTQLCGYSRPTPVQKYSVPIGEMGRDLMACAQTGSGKCQCSTITGAL